MTPVGTDEKRTERPLFETLSRELPGEGTSRENCTMGEWDGRTPYGQVSSDGVLRSIRAEVTQAAPPQRSHDIEVPSQSSSNPEKVTNRKRTIGRTMVADKVIPNMKNAAPGKRN